MSLNSLNILKPEILLENTYLFGILSLFLTVYGPRLHMKLPQNIQNLFEHEVFNFIVILLIGFMASKNIKASLIVTIMFLTVMNYSNKLNLNIFAESFNNYGPPVSSCTNYTNESIVNNKTPFYPLNAVHEEHEEHNVANF